MLQLVDSLEQTNKWSYDTYGKVIYQIDPNENSMFHYLYDHLNRVTNVTGAVNATFGYGNCGSLTFKDINSGLPDNCTYSYDALHRVTNAVHYIYDGAYSYYTNRFTYTSFGALASEDGPWSDDTITYSYHTNHLRSSLSLPSSSPWVVSYAYDAANRLQSITDPNGVYTYNYSAPGPW